VPFPNPDTQWKPGQSGNPGGRPRRKPITDRINALLEKALLTGIVVPEGKVLADLVAEAYVAAAIVGDARDRKEMTDRVEGRAILATTQTDDVDARDALRTEALEMTRARHARQPDGTRRDQGGPGEPAR
jgi:Family of unknown function (DUF5681)